MTTFTFGKYANTPLAEIPLHYLLWASETMEFSKGLGPAGTVKDESLKLAVDEAVQDMDLMTLGFGKYATTPLMDLPNDYLVWLMDNPTKSPRVNAYVEKHVLPICPMGKHKGELITVLPPKYKEWLRVNQILKSPFLQTAL